MKRVVLVALLALTFATGCPRNDPPPTNAATCREEDFPGKPPQCRDATGKAVTCPDDYKNLPLCVTEVPNP